MSLFLLVSCTTGENEASQSSHTSSQLDKNTIVRIADRMREQGDAGMAAEFYQRAINDDPKNIAAYYGLATLQSTQGATEAAERAYREALRYDAHNAEILRDYGKLLLATGNYTAAVTNYRAALAENSSDNKTRNGLGVALDQLGDHKSAQTQYQDALSHNPDDMNALNNLGMSLIMAGDYAGAIQLLAPIADSFKANDNMRQNLALAYQKAGQTMPALSAVAPTVANPDPVNTIASAPRIAVETTMPAPLLNPVSPTTPPASQQKWKRHTSSLTPPPRPVDLATMTALSTQAPRIAQATTVQTQISWGNHTRIIPATSAAAQTQPITTSSPPRLTIATAPPAPTMPSTTFDENISLASKIQHTTNIHHHAAIAAAPVLLSPVLSVSLPTSQPLDSAPIMREQRTIFGPYATDQIAQAHQAALQDKLGHALPEKAVLNLVTRLTDDGTPEFVLHLYGFHNQTDIDTFRSTAQNAGFSSQQG
jgi:Flp pilus assembly protein TadD